MAVPLDGIRAIHNAFRKDLAAMDASAYMAARQGSGLDMVIHRYTFFNEVLVWHASGEEEQVFPAVEKVAPLVAEAYERDHRGLDSLYIRIEQSSNGHEQIRHCPRNCDIQFPSTISFKQGRSASLSNF